MSTPLSADRPRSATAPALKRQGRRARRHRRLPPAAKYAVWFVALVLVALVAEFVYSTVTSEPRDARTIAERELRLNTLARGERVVREVSVFERPALDYFRATRGLLVLTDRRLLFLGLEPQDLLAAPDEPPNFTERDFPLDTVVHVSSGRTFFGFAKAIVIQTPHDVLRLGVPSQAWPRAELLLAALDSRDVRLRALGARRAAIRAHVDSLVRAASAEARKARYYTVRRGDALASIAARWNTTPERLQAWNKLPTNRIRIGQTLIVKPAM